MVAAARSKKSGTKTARKPAPKTAKPTQVTAKPSRSKPKARPAQASTGRPAVAISPKAAPTTRIPVDGDEVPLVVARSLISQGQVLVRLEAPKRIQLPLGRLLLVRHAYQLQESSPDRESYLFQLGARLGDHEKEPLVERIADRPGFTEDMSGFIQHRFRPDRPGTYQLDFSVAAEYEVRPWGSRTVRQKDRRDGKGRVTVVVA